MDPNLTWLRLGHEEIDGPDFISMPGNCVKVYLVLRRRMDWRTNQVTISRAALCRATRIKLRALKYILARLKKQHYIDSITQGVGHKDSTYFVRPFRGAIFCPSDGQDFAPQGGNNLPVGGAKNCPTLPPKEPHTSTSAPTPRRRTLTAEDLRVEEELLRVGVDEVLAGELIRTHGAAKCSWAMAEALKDPKRKGAGLIVHKIRNGKPPAAAKPEKSPEELAAAKTKLAEREAAAADLARKLAAERMAQAAAEPNDVAVWRQHRRKLAHAEKAGKPAVPADLHAELDAIRAKLRRKPSATLTAPQN